MAMKYLLYFVSFLSGYLGSEIKTDFRHISHQDLQSSLDQFTDSHGIFSYSQLLFDTSLNQLLVGGRDTLYRFEIDNLEILEKAIWEAPSTKISLCIVKGQTEQNCHNFIKVLLLYGKKVFACGTNAFSPQCSWRRNDKLSEVTEWVDGIAKCPYNPNANSTSLLSESGDFYVGGPTDFSGSDTVIYRTSIEYERSNTLITNQFNSKWLDDPQFVGSFETNHFVYIVFRENAIEYSNCGKVIYSRIARVCKNDIGGQLILRYNWSTFVKARLNCSLSGEYPFYYNEIQSIDYVKKENMMYATFSTPSNSIHGSAVCAFNLSAINAAFLGPFKYQETPNSNWEQYKSQHQHHFECRMSPNRSNQIIDSSRFQLVYNAVQPVSVNPLHDVKLERYTHIAVDVVDTKHYKSVNVIYVATDTGIVKKITVLPKTQETCVVETWSIIPPNSSSRIRSMKSFKDTKSLYITTDDSVLRIDSEHCRRHVSKSSCLNAMDPYCGWNELQEACTPAPDDNPLARFWTQSFTSCPILNTPVDGGWSSWSEWSPCNQKNNNESNSTDQCLCQTRQCNNPSPQNGGASCQGISITVSNCTVHGGWTPWSVWSECSATCGLAYKSRFRTCGNPSPAHGGRVCVGPDSAQIYCIQNPPCSEQRPLPRDGGWSSWGPWEDCSASCGGGYKIRRRKCDDPLPQNGGMECRGSHIEYEVCNLDPCQEIKKFGPWSQWMIANGSNSNMSDGYIEKRFRCSCRAQTSHHSLIKIAIAKEEERYCRYDGTCNDPSSQKWSSWSPWSECSVKCGGGSQSRSRKCEGHPDECIGPTYMSRSCNYHSCHGKWSCWSDWTECSVTCGAGMQQRTRVCLSSKNKDSPENCNGPTHQERDCEMLPCSFDNTLNIQMDRSIQNVSVSTGVVLAYCLAGFIVGLAFACFLFFFYIRTKRPGIPSSPHYLPSKQNPYITIPLQELPSKRHGYSSTADRERNSAFIMNNTNTGTLKHHKSVSDYDTATIKRNSHTMNNGHMRSENDLLDKYY